MLSIVRNEKMLVWSIVNDLYAQIFGSCGLQRELIGKLSLSLSLSMLIISTPFPMRYKHVTWLIREKGHHGFKCQCVLGWK